MATRTKGIEDAQHIMKPYYGLIMDKINLIYYTWDAGEDVQALIRAWKLCAFLVKELREKPSLKARIEAIEEGYREAMKIRGIGMFSTSVRQNRKLSELAQEHLRPFIIELMDELDERGYIEKPVLFGFRKNPKKIDQKMFKT